MVPNTATIIVKVLLDHVSSGKNVPRTTLGQSMETVNTTPT